MSAGWGPQLFRQKFDPHAVENLRVLPALGTGSARFVLGFARQPWKPVRAARAMPTDNMRNLGERRFSTCRGVNVYQSIGNLCSRQHSPQIFNQLAAFRIEMATHRPNAAGLKDSLYKKSACPYSKHALFELHSPGLTTFFFRHLGAFFTCFGKADGDRLLPRCHRSSLATFAGV